MSVALWLILNYAWMGEMKMHLANWCILILTQAGRSEGAALLILTQGYNISKKL